MLEFIVLGQIPGTQIVVTFQSVLAVASLVLGMSIAHQVTKLRRRTGDIGLKDITL